MQSIAIFGAAGALGAAMAEYFHQQGFAVVGSSENRPKILFYQLWV